MFTSSLSKLPRLLLSITSYGGRGGKVRREENLDRIAPTVEVG